jgi:hypothetical protein
MTLNQASEGFKNQGQFIAALHVSQNLNIPFKDLKAAMLGTPATTPGSTTPAGTTPTGTTPTGTTPTGTAPTGTTPTTSAPMSLGQAIHKLRPSANSTTEAQHAQTQAATDLNGTTTSTTTSGRR